MAAPGGAQAQTYPSRPVNVIVPFPAGGSTDWLARMLSQKLEQRLKGATFVVENRPGGANVVAAVSVAKAPPDGHTLLMTTSTTMAINVSVFKNLAYDPAKDFVPVALVSGVPFVLVVNAGLPVKSIADLVKRSEGEAGRARLCLDRRRLGRASLHGAAAERARHRDDGRPLQGQRAGLAGHHRRAMCRSCSPICSARCRISAPASCACSASPPRIARRRRPICRRCRRPA